MSQSLNRKSEINSGDGRSRFSSSDGRRQRRRLQFLRVAATILTDEGPDAVRIPRVAEISGVTRPSVYKYFANRQELLLGVLDELDRGLQDALDILLVSDWSDPLAKMQDVVLQISECLESWGPGAWRLLYRGGPDQETRLRGRHIVSKFTGPAQQQLMIITGASDRRAQRYIELLAAVVDTSISIWMEGRCTRDEAFEMIQEGCRSLIFALSSKPASSENREGRPDWLKLDDVS